MDLKSCMRTSALGVTFLTAHQIFIGTISFALCASRPGVGLFLGRKNRTWKREPRSRSLLVAGLLSILSAAHPPAVCAGECVGNILKMESGKVRLRKLDGESVRIDSANIAMPLCVLEVVAELPRYKVFIPDGEWKGEWLIKRRRVMEIEGALAVDCTSPVITTLEIKKADSGGYRASGEESCN